MVKQAVDRKRDEEGVGFNNNVDVVVIFKAN